ncbi:hypothetical protein Kpol_364p4 [Vanderwaltozyma polyspora DSM 70294]|uniref:Large ribosomal subunit protein mL38 n=1 Tax=Vanderwaltozyma polyspora (strain ATCC 22028 / DSM 70294 / BCRC 21397 / CBS 2163 / NBRC 10782 / NRRL Y-8283 / UCD 57-17) TaxID=436907 RepID=A7TSC0_VANPO|nr:uncharacterized protein Kpol_364p4 [Vanderwaltozyma polyspora DSM 70294]EDO14832.1 hypothetical protein Kpol_364p4 [Vanderwaltozyma polyspora DSM 70294]
MLRRRIHTARPLLENAKVWSDFSNRPKSFGIKSKLLKQALLEGTPKYGPPSIKRRSNRLKYASPEHMDDMFKISNNFLESKAAETYAEIEKTKDKAKLNQLLIKAELFNPEVQYNFQFNEKIDNNPEIIDFDQPVYRHLGRKHWESYGQMLLMQRLETLHVIPDTLPTLEPKAEINIKFPYSSGLNKWIEPGEVLSSNTTYLPPVFKIQEYDTVDPEKQLYTILIVNPDVPDLENDTFKTSLAYGLTNLKVSYNDNMVDSRKFDDSNVLTEYVAPTPDKNIGKQRYCVWVFRHANDKKLAKPSDLDTDNFNIRAFVEENGLTPIGAHVWRSEWDSNVNIIREKYGLDPVRIFDKVRD